MEGDCSPGLDGPCFGGSEFLGGQWRPRLMMDDVLWGFHENMGPTKELEFVAGLRNYAARHKGQPAPRACPNSVRVMLDALAAPELQCLESF